jgi:inosine-uridine nucleoside N-ribohydrolase
MLGMNEIPVYNGAHCSLQADYHLGNDSPQTLCHGSDGMNDVPHIIPLDVVKQPETSMNAPDAIINKVMENPGEITLVALGPLTNIAIATRFCPELPKLVKSLYIMGSSSRFGNVTQWAEFNFHCDPLAAHLTLQHFCRSCLVHVVPWEPCLDNCIPFHDYDSLFVGPGRSPAKTLIEATGMTKWLTKRKSSGQGYCFSDQLVSLLLLYPESAIESEYYDTMNVIFNEKNKKFGFAKYEKEENSGNSENKGHGLIVYKKFEMSYMIKLYEKSMRS